MGRAIAIPGWQRSLRAHPVACSHLQYGLVFPFIIQNIVQITREQALNILDLPETAATLICKGIKDVAVRTAIISVETYCEEGFS